MAVVFWVRTLARETVRLDPPGTSSLREMVRELLLGEWRAYTALTPPPITATDPLLVPGSTSSLGSPTTMLPPWGMGLGQRQSMEMVEEVQVVQAVVEIDWTAIWPVVRVREDEYTPLATWQLEVEQQVRREKAVREVTAGGLSRELRVIVRVWGGISEAEALREVRVIVYWVVLFTVAEEREWAGVGLALLPVSVTVRLLRWAICQVVLVSRGSMSRVMYPLDVRGSSVMTVIVQVVTALTVVSSTATVIEQLAGDMVRVVLACIFGQPLFMRQVVMGAVGSVEGGVLQLTKVMVLVVEGEKSPLLPACVTVIVQLLYDSAPSAMGEEMRNPKLMTVSDGNTI